MEPSWNKGNVGTTTLVMQLISQRFRAVSEQRMRNECQRAEGGGGEERKETLPSPPPPPSFIFWLSFHFSSGPMNRKSRSPVFLCSETKRKRLPCRLAIDVNLIIIIIIIIINFINVSSQNLAEGIPHC